MRRDRFAVLGAATLALAAAASAQVSGSWVIDTDGSWSVAANWSSNPLVPDAGGTASFGLFPSLSGQRSIIQDLAGVTLTQITLDSPFQYSISRPAGSLSNTITLTGAAIVDVIRSNSGSPSRIPAGHSLAGAIAGANGLTKTGPGVLMLGSGNTYTGGTRILGGVLASTGDVYGAAGASISIDNAALRSIINGFLMSRPVEITGASSLQAFAPMSFFSPIAGSGTLSLSGPSRVGFSAAHTYSGIIDHQQGTLTLVGGGSILNVPSITSGGSIVLDNANIGNTNRLGDTTPITFRGSSFELLGNSSSSMQEIVGDATFSGGVTFVSTQAVALQPTTLTMASATRAERGTVFVRGGSLGSSPPGAGVANLFFTAPPALVGGGGAAGSTNISIIPWFWGGGTNGVASNNASNGLVTYGPNGVRVLNNATEYAPALPAGVSTDNVRLTASATLSSASTVNALVISSPTGAPVSLNGSGTLGLSSGVLLTLAGTATVNTPVDFGSAEGMLIATALTTLNGPISGAAGLTKSGLGGASLTSAASDYTGQTTIVGGNITYVGDVLPNAAGPLGSDSSAIVLAPGGLSGVTGASAARLWAGAAGTTVFSRDLVARGNSYGVCGFGTAFSDSGQVVVMNGSITVETHLQFQGDQFTPMIINGTISGPGRLSDGFASSQVLNGNNSYTGGTDIQDGAWLVGHNNALGSGTVWLSTAGGRLAASGAPRTLANPVVMLADLVINGAQALTLAGPIDLGGLTVTHTIDNTALTTYAGPVSYGGIIKAGSGTLVLAGDNDYTGVTTINSGVVVAAHPHALGGDHGSVAINPGASLHVAPALAAPVVLRGISIAVTGSADLTDNDLIVTYVGPTPAPTIRAMLIDDRIASSLADATRGLGYADDGDSVLIKYTWFGDANLDGQVDITDLGNLATNWQSSNVWSGGDFDFSGFVDITDLGMLATNWQAGVGNPLAPAFNDALAAFGLSGAAVPEPLTPLLSLLLAALPRRRRERT